jgi:hypothetical protein
VTRVVGVFVRFSCPSSSAGTTTVSDVENTGNKGKRLEGRNVGYYPVTATIIICPERLSIFNVFAFHFFAGANQ